MVTLVEVPVMVDFPRLGLLIFVYLQPVEDTLTARPHELPNDHVRLGGFVKKNPSPKLG